MEYILTIILAAVSGGVSGYFVAKVTVFSKKQDVGDVGSGANVVDANVSGDGNQVVGRDRITN